MSTPLLSPLAARRRFRRLIGTAAGFALMLAAPAAAQAQTIFGLSGTDLTSVNLASPATSQTRVAITGITAGQALVGLDFRPATGELFALGYDASTAGNNARLYVINQTTAVATPVGAAAVRLELGGSTERIAFDFNPTVDRIRVAGTNDANYRLNPNNGTLATPMDTNLAYVAGDANAGQNPYIGTAAYTNSFIGAATTTLYYIDEQRSTLVRSDNPNGGSLATVVPISPTAGGNPTPINSPGTSTDLDIYTFGPNDQQSYLSVNLVDGNGNFILFVYRLNLATGATTFSGAIQGTGVGITDIAIRIDRTAPAVSGRQLYAVSTNNNLLSFNSGTPGFINSSVAITGIATGQTLVGTDFRPNTGQLFGLGYNAGTGESRLYTIDLTTAVATPVGSGPITLALGDATDNIGFDFNPTVDRIRVVSTNRADFRLNPNNGALAATDGQLTYAAGDANASQTPRIGSVGYTNSYPGSTSTTLYDIDEALSTLAIQNPPNAGTLNTTGPLTGLTLSSSNALVDVDVYFDRSSLVNEAYLTANPNGQTTSNLYTLALGSGATTLVGAIGLGIPVRDISAQLAGADASAQLMPGVRLLYGVAGGNLVSFASDNPTVIRTAVNITGLPVDGSQVLVGTDFSPATGELFALGYNVNTQQGQLYKLDISTGALAAVGSLNSYNLGTTAASIGFDFNPTVNLIRVTSGTNQANLRVNPATGAVTVDTNLSNPSGTPVLTGVAYTNNDNNANTGTTLYGIDQARSVLLRSTNANAGTYVDQGSLGVALNTALGADFDIYSDLSNAALPGNAAFLAAGASGSSTDNLYTVDLTAGNASLVGRIGSGTNLTGLAAFLTPGPTIAAGLTWTGAVSTDWGTAGNWSPAQVPTATDNVTIPDVANDPVVTGNQLANAVTLNTGAVLTLADGSVLSVSGNIVNNSATITSSGTNVTGRITLAGAAAQTISGTLTTFPNLTVGAAGASIGGPVSIRRGLVLNGTFTTASQTLTLLSDATGTAYVVNNGGAAVAGAATVQRYITPTNPGPGYRHYSTPVSGNTVSDFTTPSYLPVVNSAYNSAADPRMVQPYPTVFYYDQSRLATSNLSYAVGDFDNGFLSPGALTDGLVVGRGYTVNIGGTNLVDFTGTLNNGAYSSGALARGAQSNAGYHLLGNPYPGAINYNTVLGASTGIESALYVFKSNGQYTGTYTSYVNGASTNTGTNVLPVGQGFFVRVAAGQTGNVSFTNAARLDAPDNTPFQRTTGTRPELTLALRSATAANQAVLYFEQGATTAFDAGFDSHYLPSTNGLLLATEAGSETLAINGLPLLTGADVVVPLRVAVATAGTYNLMVDNLANLPTGYFAYLRDGLTGTYVNLATTPSVALTLAANGAAGGRYAVVFSKQSQVLASAPAALAQLATVFPNPAHGTATLLLPVALRGQQATAVMIVDNVGRVVLSRTLAAGTAEALELPIASLAPGVYSVVARTAAGLVAKRLVVE
ncbi:DUF4394 domain-containing protein [Hymenobacter sp. DH14]|uniref:DUF4394 domain-containing protein n=1 Tax=Hymenobacter cyanobacteriorum TaxID=2926463 RepID=A0A9X1VHX5_9BACT|nr:DUF4394 domain-containing protein [Hymenobacter cyanobacteriorum]MCI1188463.1 DUF4394 domain-containing protein [Hymenobacter cyanobacteriorum]